MAAAYHLALVARPCEIRASHMSPADLSRDTAAEPVPKSPGHYVVELPDHWNYVNPSGGVLLSAALRAIVREIGDPSYELLSATTLFCQPILAGRLLVVVSVLRRGERAIQVRASLTALAQPGPGLEVIATLARDGEGPDVHGVSMPDVPVPEEAAAPDDGAERAKLPFPFYRNVDVALAIGEPMWKPGWSQGPSHVAYWYRHKVPQVTADGRFDPIALPPIADTMPGALTRKLGPDHERYMMPSIDLSVFFIARPKSEWILVESFVERARGGYAVGSATLWDREGGLVARAAQTMTLRPLRRRPR